MKSRKVPFADSGQRLARVIDTFARGSLKQFESRLRGKEVTRGSNHRYMVDYRLGRRRIPESVIMRVREVYPSVLPGYLRGTSPFMTPDDQRDAEQRAGALVAQTTGAAQGVVDIGDIFKVTGVDRGVRDALAALEMLTPGGHVARSPLHEVWHRVCEIEGLPEGARRLMRLKRLVRQVDGLLPRGARPSGASLETFRLGVLAAMLAALEGARR